MVELTERDWLEILEDEEFSKDLVLLRRRQNKSFTRLTTKLIKLRSKGLTASDIAKLYNTSISEVIRKLEKLGL